MYKTVLPYYYYHSKNIISILYVKKKKKYNFKNSFLFFLKYKLLLYPSIIYWELLWVYKQILVQLKNDKRKTNLNIWFILTILLNETIQFYKYFKNKYNNKIIKEN